MQINSRIGRESCKRSEAKKNAETEANRGKSPTHYSLCTLHSAEYLFFLSLSASERPMQAAGGSDRNQKWVVNASSYAAINECWWFV